MDASKFVESLINDVMLGGIEDVQQAVDTYFTPDYEQHTDGHVLSKAEFVDHVRHVRARGLTQPRMTVQDVVFDGTTIADVHTINAVKPDGGPIELEVYMFAELRDGKVARIKELSRLVTGGAEDSDLGHAH